MSLCIAPLLLITVIATLVIYAPLFLVAKRFKNFRRFLYQYEAETLNGVNGATNLKNGPKVTCKVRDRQLSQEPSSNSSVLSLNFHSSLTEGDIKGTVLWPFLFSFFSQVEIDVPQTCSFILRTPECSLSEVIHVDTEGSAVFAPAAGAEAFQAAMAKYVITSLLSHRDLQTFSIAW